MCGIALIKVVTTPSSGAEISGDFYYFSLYFSVWLVSLTSVAVIFVIRNNSKASFFFFFSGKERYSETQKQFWGESRVKPQAGGMHALHPCQSQDLGCLLQVWADSLAWAFLVVGGGWVLPAPTPVSSVAQGSQGTSLLGLLSLVRLGAARYPCGVVLRLERRLLFCAVSPPSSSLYLMRWKWDRSPWTPWKPHCPCGKAAACGHAGLYHALDFSVDLFLHERGEHRGAQNLVSQEALPCSEGALVS